LSARLDIDCPIKRVKNKKNKNKNKIKRLMTPKEQRTPILCVLEEVCDVPEVLVTEIM
jgi:hypothetical protein